MGEATSSKPRGLAKLSQSLPFWLLVALAVLAVVMLVETPRYALGDDNVQALFVSGRYLNEPSLLMPYTLAPLSVPMALAYRALPQIPWYPLVLSALTVVSYGVALRQAASADAPAFARRAAVVVLLALEVACTLFFTYTVVAFLAVAAGLSLLLPKACFGDARGVRARDVWGLVLVAAGFSLRPESGLATLVVFSPFLVWALVFCRRPATLARAAAVVVAVAACYGAGMLAYQTTPGWEGFVDYLNVGRNVLDFPEASVADMQAAVPELSENDVLMLQDWNFVDSSVFSDDVFVRAQAAVPHYSASYARTALAAKRSWATLALGLAFVALSVALARARRSSLSSTLLTVAVGALGALSYLLVILRARPKFQVLLPIAVVTLMALVVCCSAPRARAGRHASRAAQDGGGRRPAVLGRVGLCVVVLACAGALGYFHHAIIRPIHALIGSELSENANAYVRDNPDTLVVAAQTQTSLFGYDVWGFERWQYPDNLLMVGGWESHTAPWGSFLSRWGLTRDDTLTALATRDDMVALLLPSTAELFQTYLQEHVNPDVRMELVETVGEGVSLGTPNSVYRFTIPS